MDRLGRSSASLFIWFFFCVFTLLLMTTTAYKNFTVGDDIGWVYPVLNPSVNYTKWAAGKEFSLGDYLIFNYPDKNHSVVMTRNQSVYTSCDFLDSNDDDYEVYGEAGVASRSEVPLVETGETYFFCSAFSGDHCKGGMKFAINVSYGEGLPPNLATPPPQPTSPEGSPSSDESPPASTEDEPPPTSSSSNTNSNEATLCLGSSNTKQIFITLIILLWIMVQH
eukprot:c16150_g1_i1 orf=584-1252(+)